MLVDLGVNSRAPREDPIGFVQSKSAKLKCTLLLMRKAAGRKGHLSGLILAATLSLESYHRLQGRCVSGRMRNSELDAALSD